MAWPQKHSDVETNDAMASAAGEPVRAANHPLTIGRYVVRRLLGQGGMGQVFEAYDPELARKVAIKVVLAAAFAETGISLESANRTMLLGEARNLAKFSHPNIVPVYDVGETSEGSVFLAMEFVAGETVRAAIDRKRFAWREWTVRLLEACDGLAAAHAVGILHRDIKPENLIIGQDARVRVLDFGLARQTSAIPSKSQADDRARQADAPMPMSGTPAYMPPEQMLGESLAASSDLFSLACVIFEALTGKRPFPASPPLERLAAIDAASFHWPAAIPRWLRHELARAMAYDSEQRHGSVEDFVRALRFGLRREQRRRTYLWSMLGVSAGVGFAGLVLTRPQPPLDPLCRAPTAQLDAIWTEQASAQIEARFLQSNVPLAADVWQRSKRSIESYYEAWKKSAAAICRDAALANSADTSKSESTLLPESARWCLSECSAEVEALATVWKRATRSQVLEAPRAVATLTDPQSCADPSALRARAPLPIDLEARQKVLDLKRKMGAVAVHLRQADYPETSARLAELRPKIIEALHPPTMADFFSLYSGLKIVESELINDSSIPLFQALAWGTAANLPRIAANSSAGLWFTRAYIANHVEESDELLGLQHAILQRTDKSRDLFANYERNRGILLSSSGAFDEAMVHFRLELEHRKSHFGPRAFEVARAFEDLGVTAYHAGDYEQAMDYFYRGYEIQLEINGLAHRRTLDIAANYQASLEAAGRPYDALVFVLNNWHECEQAAAGWQTCATPQRSFGRLSEILGNYRDAQPIFAENLEREREAGRRLNSSQASVASTLSQLLRQRGETGTAFTLARESLASIRAEPDAALPAVIESKTEAFWAALADKQLPAADAIVADLARDADIRHVTSADKSSTLPRILAASAMAHRKWHEALDHLALALDFATKEHEPPQNRLSLILAFAQTTKELGAWLWSRDIAVSGLEIIADVPGLADHHKVPFHVLLAEIAVELGEPGPALEQIELARLHRNPVETLVDFADELEFVERRALLLLSGRDSHRPSKPP
jgi:serine/threonine protein kinase